MLTLLPPGAVAADAPTEPTAPESGPTEPTIPAAPTGPSAPGDPTTPTEPSAPGDPTSPSTPAEPSAPTETAEPAETPEPAKTPEPTKSPEPTKTPEPTKSPEPTKTPEPSKPPEPTKTPEPSKPPEPTEPGMSAFQPAASAKALKFTDVPAGIWYADAAALLSKMGLVEGTDNNRFDPDSMLTAGACAALSVRIYALYHGLSPDLKASDPAQWYVPYMREAVKYGILPSGWKADAVLTRKQALYLTFRTLPKQELSPLRKCMHIPGLFLDDPQIDEILCLYDAGILSGTDAYGRLDGDSRITRAQYITLLARLIDPKQRDKAPLAQRRGMDAFDAAHTPTAHPFTDIPKGIYYDESVGMLYQMGLVNGIGTETYAPGNHVTVLQAAILAVRVHELYHGKDRVPHFYDPAVYLSLAHEYGILPESWKNTDRNATRAEVARLIAHAFPEAAFPGIRKVASVPDVGKADPYAKEILLLYRAGVLTGSDTRGTFHGRDAITRGEFAAMFERTVNPAHRKALDLGPVEDAVQNALAGYAGSWSVYVEDFATGESFCVNPQRMRSASIIKLYVMGAVLEAIRNGSLANSPNLQGQLNAMITWSSNDAWKSLAAQLGGGSYSYGMQLITDWCDRNQYPDSGVRDGRNKSSPADSGLFLHRVLLGKNVSADDSALMLDLLRQQQWTGKIPAGVPAGVPTANKTGELDDVQNDAAIIFAPFGTYVLVVMTENSYILNIRELSSIVYDAMAAAHQ